MAQRSKINRRGQGPHLIVFLRKSQGKDLLH